MTEEIDRQILHKYDIESKLGKGVRLRQQEIYTSFSYLARALL